MTQKAGQSSAKEDFKDPTKPKVEPKDIDPQAMKIKKAQTGVYVANENERHLFHVKLDKPFFNKRTGEKQSKAYMQKFTIPEWHHFAKNSKGLGFEVEIMWNPEKYK